jgi:hypothetical protein
MSGILESLGMGNIDIGIFIIGLLAAVLVLLVITVVILIKFAKLNKRYAKFMQGNTARSLEEDIVRLYESSKYVKQESENNRKDIDVLYGKVAKTFQKIGLVKYDAFNQMGGKLSFSLVLLDEEDNGFVLNSVHSAEGCYSYTKEIANGESAGLLGEEEKQALGMAMAKN